MVRAPRLKIMVSSLQLFPFGRAFLVRAADPAVIIAYARMPVMTMPRKPALSPTIIRPLPLCCSMSEEFDQIVSTVTSVRDCHRDGENDIRSTLDIPRRERKAAQRHRSYRRRQGSITKRQRRTLRELWPTHGLEMDFARRWDFDEIFRATTSRDPGCGVTRPCFVLDIGFGVGESLLGMAAARPGDRFLGIEGSYSLLKAPEVFRDAMSQAPATGVHKPGIATALARLDAEGLTNVKIAAGDAVKALMDHVMDRSLDECCVFFPDPFPQDRESDRRLIRPFVLTLLSKKLRIGGVLHVATDVDVYADHVSKVLSGSSKAVEALENGGALETVVRWEGGDASERPSWRPVTNYERKAIEAGRRVRDFSYRLMRADMVDSFLE